MVDRFSTVVVGGGCSGALVATHLLAAGERVAVIEPASHLGRGLAYRTQEPAHLLNSRAATMSALDADPGDFLTWCRAHGVPADGGAFLPRLVYGDYLETTLETAAARAPGRLRRVRDCVGRVRRDERGVTLKLRGGRELRGDRVVLAAGHAPPVAPAFVCARARCHPGFVGDPWGRYALDALHPDAPVLLLGTGLTAVDVAVSLVNSGHRGQLIAVSRRGLLPQPHLEPGGCGDTPPEPPSPATPRALLRWLRHDRRSGPPGLEAVGVDPAGTAGGWRSRVDALRPHADRIWSDFSEAERELFLRHLVRHWEVHRHRLAPPAAATVARLRASGQLRILAGRVTALSPAGACLDAVLTTTSGPVERHRVCAVVNCTGPGSANRLPVVHALIADGLARPDRLGLGLDTDPDGRLIDRSGRINAALWAVGPLRRGGLWETTAVPEIRRQAARLAA
jgi:uncharacterized NAD(P)/FAD-binding protein YdhS